MQKLRIYLDTSVISHLFHDDAPERQAITLEFFDATLKANVYDCFISAVVLDELRRARDPNLREKLLDVAARPEVAILPDDETEVARLARIYVQHGVVPKQRPEDALHVAYATVFEMDVLVTWNFRHLAKARTAELVAGINLIEGYSKPLHLLTPLEVLEP